MYTERAHCPRETSTEHNSRSKNIVQVPKLGGTLAGTFEGWRWLLDSALVTCSLQTTKKAWRGGVCGSFSHM
jgi:hypothetical protein